MLLTDTISVEKIQIEKMWNTASSVMCNATLQLFPGAVPVIGGVEEKGFFYDFYNLHLENKDFELIENRVRDLIRSELPLRIKDLDHHNKSFIINKFRETLLQGHKDLYLCDMGSFKDLVRYDNIVSSLHELGSFKITNTSSSYWLGDKNREVLTRVFGIAFSSKKDMKCYLEYLEEVKKRDHRVIGKRKQLFMFSEYAPGSLFMLPLGMKLFNALSLFWKEIHDKFGYIEIKTPAICNIDLWKMSGHTAHYIENMFKIKEDDSESSFALKAMNCPATMLVFKNMQVSYNDLPLRISEKGCVFRNESSGSLSGLCRLKSFHQDDAHIFVSKGQIKGELNHVLDVIQDVYSIFKLEYSLEIATRPEKSCGTDEAWKESTQALIDVVSERGMKVTINEGDGAFYGPKIDVYIKDSIRRVWQCGTIQLDFGIAERFDLTYVDNKNCLIRPIVIHRAIFGSFERFLAILIEHFSGRMPLWISPNQVALIALNDSCKTVAEKIKADLLFSNCQADIVYNSHTLSKNIRDLVSKDYNYIITIGNRECSLECIPVRVRGSTHTVSYSYSDFIKKIEEEIKTRTS